MDIIFDVDGTLLDITHRIHLIRPSEGGKKDWEAFRAAARDDKIIWPIMHTLRALRHHGHSILVVTGRMEKERPLLLRTIGDQMYWDPDIPIYMRKNDDVRPDHVVKLEILHEIRLSGYKPVLTFDDRNQVVNMWRAQGIVCAQVAPGEF